VAEENAIRLGLDGTVLFHLGDLLGALPLNLKGKCHFIVSNPPYVKEWDFLHLPPEVREHEPYMSLVSGPLGMEKHLLLMAMAPLWLAPGGWLLMEGAENQMDTLSNRAEELGYDEANVLLDLNHKPRVIEMRWNR
jgi:release factor glutamine methyltransferase